MNWKITFLVLLLTDITLAGIPEASAIPQYLTAFETNYPSAVGTRIDQCLLCHTNPFGGARNPYGTDFQEKDLIIHNFTYIEPFDSDGDGFTNIDEIHNRTFPGEAIDFPRFGVGLTADTLSKTTITGINATYTLTITNTGSLMDNYTLAVDNPDGAIADLSTNLVQNLAAGANTTVLLNVTNATAGTFMVNVTATSQGDPNKTASVNTTTIVSVPPVTFTITATAGANGTISPSGAVVVNSGANQTFTLTPNAGFVVDNVVVDEASQGALTTYTFTNVQANHTIDASFVPAVNDISLTTDALSKITITGTNATYTLTITNTGNMMDNYTLAVDNTDGAIAGLGTDLVQNLAAGANITVLLNVTSTTAGNFMVNVTATSQGNSTKKASVNTTTIVSVPPTTSSSSGGGGGGGGGGGVSGENYTNIEVKEKYDLHIFKDAVTSYAFTDKSNPIRFVNITGNVSAGEINVAVEILKGTSTLVNISPPGIVYKNINIWVGGSGFAMPRNIKEAKITARIEKSWLSANNLKGEDIKVLRWDGIKWNELKTSHDIPEDATYHFCEAVTNAFSSFAIVSTKGRELIQPTAILPAVQSTVTTVTPTEAPPAAMPPTSLFWTLYVVAAIIIIAVIYYAVKKKVKGTKR